MNIKTILTIALLSLFSSGYSNASSNYTPAQEKTDQAAKITKEKKKQTPKAYGYSYICRVNQMNACRLLNPGVIGSYCICYTPVGALGGIVSAY